MIIYCDRIYMRGGIKDGFLKIEDGKLVDFFAASADLKADKDYRGYRLIPGVFDTHNHGGFGYSLMALDAVPKTSEIKAYLKGQASWGVTSILPTTCNVATIALLADLADEQVDGAKICGIHSEGPWGARVGEKGINTGYPPVDMELAKQMVAAGKGKLKLIDIAPEVEGALVAIRFFVDQGIAVGAFHTNANYEEANRGIDAGITVATHLGNVMTGLHHRDIGTLGACLLRPEVDCEIICDDMHISLEIVKIFFKVKDLSKFIMISDNVLYAGAPAGRYKGMTQDVNSDRISIRVTEDGFVLSETGRLSGSSKPVMYGIKNLVEKLQMPLEQVILLSSLNPAKKYGFGATKGELAIGKDADLVAIDDNFDVVATFSEGRQVFDREVDGNLFNPEYIKAYKLD